ncbi:MAG TPA: hypothetical protein VMW27_07015, partial [Thermoanaerobaculia bacterium]|nr:hypothetical protein [Thermoanaerobaculia bacterium]
MLDTHAFLWFISGDSDLSDYARRLVENPANERYGGGRVGLMGVVADAVLAAGGEVIGVIPYALEAREVAHTELTELRVV